MKRYRIHVLPEDIMKGNKGQAMSCPIARAVKRVVQKKNKVYGDTIEIDGLTIGLPKKCEQFVERFDDHGPTKVKPFCFTLRIPE